MKKIIFVLAVTILVVTLISGCIDDFTREKENIFSVDVFSFDNKIIFVMNEPFVTINGYFDVSVEGEYLNSSHYDVYYESNNKYSKHTFIVIHSKYDGTKFIDGEDVKLVAYFAHPNYDFDFYTCEICSSCMRINEGWYPYDCEFD